MAVGGAYAFWQNLAASREEAERYARIFRDNRSLADVGGARATRQRAALDTPQATDVADRAALEQKRAQDEAQRKIAEDKRLAAEAEAARADAERKRAADEASRKAAEEMKRLADAEAARVAADRKRAEDEAARKAADEMKRLADAEAARAVAERARAEDAEARKIADEKRLAAEAEAQRLAAERKQAEEVAARKATEEKRLAAEAEAQRLAAERKQAEETAARKAAEEKRLAAEAEAQRLAAERKLAEELAEHKSADEKRAEAAAAAEVARIAAEQKSATAPLEVASLATAATAKPTATPSTSCSDADLTVDPLPAGQSRIKISAPCRKSQSVKLLYGQLALTRALDANGSATVLLDQLYPDATPVIVDFGDGLARTVVPPSKGSETVTKIAIVWQGPVDLNLHALEYAALPGEPGHVWSGASSSHDAAQQQSKADARGHGFLSAAGEPGSTGERMQVYTFVPPAAANPDAPSGVVSMLVDYVSRGDVPQGEFCGTGKHSTVTFDVYVRTGDAEPTLEHNVIPAAPCGKKLERSDRLIAGAVPNIRVRN